MTERVLLLILVKGKKLFPKLKVWKTEFYLTLAYFALAPELFCYCKKMIRSYGFHVYCVWWLSWAETCRRLTTDRSWAASQQHLS